MPREDGTEKTLSWKGNAQEGAERSGRFDRKGRESGRLVEAQDICVLDWSRRTLIGRQYLSSDWLIKLA